MEKFIIVREEIRKVRNFRLMGRSVEFKIKPVPRDEEPVGWVKDAISQIVQKSTIHLNPTDQVGITFSSNDFEHGSGYMTFRIASQMTTEEVWNIISGIFQSNSSGMNLETFQLNVTSVRMPKGRGRGRVSKFNSFNEECARRKGIIAINNSDNLCLPRAIVVAIAYANKDSKYKDVQRDIRKEQTIRAHKLVECASVDVPIEGCGIEEIELFQRHLQDYKITVYTYGSKGRNMIFEGPENKSKINLIYHNRHYNVITSLTAAFACVYYCEQCHQPFNTKTRHRCGGTCRGCLQSPKCAYEQKIKCIDCNRSFLSTQCFEKHQQIGTFDRKHSVCQKLKCCELCFKTIKSERKHECNEIYCKICGTHKSQEHLCYMQPDVGRPKLKGFLFVFYDMESRQETNTDKGDLLHEPNLCVYKTVCDTCIDDTTNNNCVQCGQRLNVSLQEEEFNWLHHTPVEWFMTKVMNLRKRFKKVVVVAHNGQAYDHQFLLNYILNKTDLTPHLIMRGTKILKMDLENIMFIDSLNYFPMALAALPKAFDLGDNFKKGYFPHLFNTLENEKYVGTLPDKQYYSPDTMKTEERSRFLQWYKENENSIFDFKKEIVEYCISDVNILVAACLKFRSLLLQVGNVCPFTESCTIASACNKVYRRNFLKPNTIGLIPKGGYRWRDTQSCIATRWLLWIEHERQINIVHSAKEREAILAGSKVDGYCKELNQIFQFHGCFYHSCPKCFKFNRDAVLQDNPTETHAMRYESTTARTERLREMGYIVEEKWECDFRREMSLNPEIEKYTSSHPLLAAIPLKPRDAFYGGRTGNCKEYYEVKPGEKIKYVDVCSLYPWVCKYGKFPIGHPKVIVGHEECSKLELSNTDGLIKCSILPPQDLYHPVLPLKQNNKLMFVLCRKCGEDMDQKADCTHTDKERTLHGTWVIDEVLKAIEKGYKILHIDEIWSYTVLQYDSKYRTGGLFTEMMNKFIKIKQEASGWPSSCTSDMEKIKYIEEFLINEGIELEYANISKNSGLRALGKLILNSFWGKLGQRENQPKTCIIRNPAELYDMLVDPKIDVNGILPVNEEAVLVNWEHIEEAYEPLSTVNVALAAYTTSQARLKLYSYLEQLEQRVLYWDTDSVIYISRKGEWDVPLGDFIGEMTDELEPKYGPGSFIQKFASGGPKHYGFEVFSEKGIATEVKVKGITLNYTTEQLVNFAKIAEMILKRCDPVPVITTKILRTSDHQVVSHVETKICRPLSTKRKFNTDHNSVPYGFIKKQQN